MHLSIEDMKAIIRGDAYYYRYPDKKSKSLTYGELDILMTLYVANEPKRKPIIFMNRSLSELSRRVKRHFEWSSYRDIITDDKQTMALKVNMRQAIRETPYLLDFYNEEPLHERNRRYKNNRSHYSDIPHVPLDEKFNHRIYHLLQEYIIKERFISYEEIEDLAPNRFNRNTIAPSIEGITKFEINSGRPMLTACIRDKSGTIPTILSNLLRDITDKHSNDLESYCDEQFTACAAYWQKIRHKDS